MDKIANLARANAASLDLTRRASKAIGFLQVWLFIVEAGRDHSHQLSVGYLSRKIPWRTWLEPPRRDVGNTNNTQKIAGPRCTKQQTPL